MKHSDFPCNSSSWTLDFSCTLAIFLEFLTLLAIQYQHNNNAKGKKMRSVINPLAICIALAGTCTQSSSIMAKDMKSIITAANEGVAVVQRECEEFCSKSKNITSICLLTGVVPQESCLEQWSYDKQKGVYTQGKTIAEESPEGHLTRQLGKKGWLGETVFTRQMRAACREVEVVSGEMTAYLDKFREVCNKLP